MSGASVHTFLWVCTRGCAPHTWGVTGTPCAPLTFFLLLLVAGACSVLLGSTLAFFSLLSMPPFLVNTEGAAPCLMALSVGECLAVGLWTPPPGAGSGDPISPTPGRLLEFLVLRERVFRPKDRIM